MTQPIGILPGKGYTKAFHGMSLTSARCASVAATDTQAYLRASGVGSGTVLSVDLRDLGESTPWLIGEDAMRAAQGRLVAPTDRARYDSIAVRALLRGMLSQIVPADAGPLTIVTGMPAAWFNDPQTKASLERAVQEAAARWGVRRVTIVPEAAAVYYCYVLEGGRVNAQRIKGDIGVIDIGHTDVNFALFANGQFLKAESLPRGMRDSVEQVKQILSSDPAFRVELSLHDVDAALRTGQLVLRGQSHTLPEAAFHVLASNAAAIIGAAKAFFPSGGDMLDAIVLGGGGAVAYAAPLARTFGQLVVPGVGPLRDVAASQIRQLVAQSDPQLTVRGLAALAAQQGQR